MSTRGMPQPEKSRQMRRSTRMLTDTSGIIGFVPVHDEVANIALMQVPVYALATMALAQARPVQEAAV